MENEDNEDDRVQEMALCEIFREPVEPVENDWQDDLLGFASEHFLTICFVDWKLIPNISLKVSFGCQG